MPTINNSSKKTLSAVFDKSVFNIPKYQRAYAWEESNWRELWDDIKNNVFLKDKEHFLGAIIYYHGSSENSKFTQCQIIDGQQRLTTITILLRVLYEKLKESDEDVYSRFADELYSKYICDLKSDAYFLNLSKKDNAFFRDYIQKESPLRKQGKLISNKNIRKCYEFFSEKISELEVLNDKSQKLEEVYWDLKKRLDTNLIFVVIDVTTDADAYMIFESINSKRQNLTISDLLKNYIFSAAEQYGKNKPDSNKLALTESGWEKMEQDLDKIDVNQYIRHFWISKYKKVFEKELYQEIKLEFGLENSKIMSFFDEVVSESGTYASMVNASIPDFPQSGLRALEQLKHLRNRQYYPLILSALKSTKCDVKEVSVLVQQIASVAVRRAIIGKNPNELEAFFANNASRLRNETVLIPKLVKELSGPEYWINDEDIVSELGTTNFEDQEYLAKFILREFELSKSPASEKIINKVTLEHVMPRTLGVDCDYSIPPERHEDFLWNIGNLALIGQKYNSEMSNKCFSKKKVYLSKSEIKTTKAISNFSAWTAGEITERNSEISKFLIQWWPKYIN